MGRGPHLYGIIYLVIGLVVASSHGYLANLASLAGILEAILAIVLWPLVLLGVNLTTII